MIYDPTGQNQFVGFAVHEKRYSQIRALIGELTGGQSDTALKMALKHHGIDFDSSKEDPTIYFIVHEEQMDEFKKAGISPTWAQIIGTSPCFANTKEECVRKFEEMA